MILGLIVLIGGGLFALCGWLGTTSIKPDPDRSFWLTAMGINKKGKILSYDEITRPYFPWSLMILGVSCMVLGIFLLTR